jgi:outer membrane protein assembly factor BamB
MRMRINMQLPPAIVAYVGGFVHALDPLTGNTVWERKLPKAYKASIGTVLIDGDVVLAGVGGRVYCLDLSSGRVLWTNEMPGLGLGMVAVATPATSANGAAQAAQAAANAQAAAVAAAGAAAT